MMIITDRDFSVKQEQVQDQRAKAEKERLYRQVAGHQSPSLWRGATAWLSSFHQAQAVQGQASLAEDSA